MDFAVIPIEKVMAAFARALAMNSDREAAARAAAQALGITVEAVREVVDRATPVTMDCELSVGLSVWQDAPMPFGPVTVMHGSPDCVGFAHPLSGRSEIDSRETA